MTSEKESTVIVLDAAPACGCLACEIVRGEMMSPAAINELLDASPGPDGRRVAFVVNSEGDAI